MKKLAIITTLLCAVLSCSKDQDDTVYEKYKGTWDIEQKFVDHVEVPVNECDSLYNRMIIKSQEQSHWVFCTGIGNDANNHKIEFDVDANGKILGMLLEPIIFPSLNKTFIEGKIANNIFEITYTNYNEPDIIRTDKFKKK